MRRQPEEAPPRLSAREPKDPENLALGAKPFRPHQRHTGRVGNSQLVNNLMKSARGLDPTIPVRFQKINGEIVDMSGR